MLAGFCILSLSLYSNNIGNRLVYDDHEVITNNEAVHGLRNTARIFTTASWWSSRASYVRHYRPLTTWSYALDYSVHGLDPRGYHLLNNLLHGVVCGILFLLLVGSGLPIPGATLSTLLFLTHPVHAEAVNWVNARADLLAGCFILLSVLFHAQAATAQGRRRVLLVTGALVSFLLAGLSKESGFMAPFVVIAWDVIILSSASGGRWLRHVRSTAWPEYLAYAVLLLAFVVSRGWFVGGATEATVSPMASPLSDAGLLQRFLTGTYVMARYAGLLLWPGGLSVDYSPAEITAVSSVTDGRALLGVAVVAACVVVAAFSRRHWPVSCFAMTAAAIVFTPVANVLFPVGTIMAERLMYLPLAALCVPLGEALGRATRHKTGRRFAPVVAVLLLAGYSARTYQRTEDWTDELSLFRSALAVSPRSAMAHKNLASVLQRTGRCEEAITLAERAVEILPEFPDAHLVLGNGYFATGRYADAAREYQATLSLVPAHASAHMNLGATYHVLGRYEEALDETDTALAADPHLSLAWFNRVHILVAMGDLEGAERALEVATARFPNHPAEAEARARVARTVSGPPR